MSEWRRIDDLADIRRGASPRPIGDPKYFGGEVGWVRIADVTRASRFLRETEQYVSPLGESLSVRVNPGDLVMSICGTLGRPIIIDMPACIHDGFVQFSNLRDADSSYLFYALQYAEPAFYGIGQPGTQTNLNTGLVGRYKLFAPRKGEQRRIAEILSTVDETIEQTDALIAKYQQVKAGLMHDLFTCGVTPDGKLRPPRNEAPHLYKDSPLGWIPKEWECPTIGELFTRRVERGKQGLPIMSITMSGGLVERDSVDRRVESNLSPEDHLLVREGDIAYNMMRMWQGVLGRAEYDCLVSPAYVVMKPGPRIEPVFAEYLLSTKSSIAWFKRLSYGVVDDRLRLYFRDLVRIPLRIPRSLPEQHAISKRLQLLDSSIQQTAMYLTKLRQQKQGLMHDLLTGRVRVKVAEAAIPSSH